MGAPCPRLTQAQDEFNESPLMTRVNEEHKQLYEFLSNHSGKIVDCPQKVDYLYDALHIEVNGVSLRSIEIIYLL